MYKLPSYEEKDATKILAFMKANPFVTIIGFDGTYPVATQVPVQVYEDADRIRVVGHMMKKTDHHNAFSANPNVLILFTGAHAYVSAAVYENPAVASTWNYSSVQVKGAIRLMDAPETRAVIKSLTDSYEEPSTSPAAFQHMSDDYIDHHLKAIAGFEVWSTSIDTVFKLSQNHSKANRRAIINNLTLSDDLGSKAVAEQMDDEGS